MRFFFHRSILLGLCLVALPTVLLAQSKDSSTLGPFDTQGSVTVGYRFTDIGGRKEKFKELYNLEQGFRLMDFNLTGRASTGIADSFSFTASGLGGDPFPGGQFTMRKTNRYDLRVNYRQSYYYWDRNDNVMVPPAPGVSSAVASDLMTSNHDFATVRRFGSANLTVHASKKVRLLFEYDRNGRSGVNFTTRTLDYFGSSSTWGSFLRANPYYVEAPIHESTNRFTGGISYSPRNWSLHYRLGYQTFHQLMDWANVESPQLTFETSNSARNNEALNSAQWTETRELKTPVSEFSVHGRPNRRVELRGGYLFYRYKGPDTMQAIFDGNARTNSSGSIVAPYHVDFQTQADLKEPNHVADAGATFKVTGWWNLHTDYRYSRFTVDSLIDFHSLVNSTTDNQGEGTYQWKHTLHQGDINFEFLPKRGLILRPGIRFMRRDINVFEDGVLDPVRSRLINTAWPTLGAYYQPNRMFSVRGDFQSITNGASYTRISAHTDVGGRVVFRFRPTDKITVEDNLVLRNRKFLETDFKNNIHINSFNIAYDMNEHFGIFGGFSYDSWFATARVEFQRGTPPPQQTCSVASPCIVTWHDQTINRVWSAGLSVKPAKQMGFNFSGNFVRTTGAGEISGELPYYGPMTWPMATGTLWYDFPKAGRLSIDLQRTYYLEEIIRGNDFNASILAIRWTRDF
ncbi:MAG: hypothetical protein HY508_15300 [Acidobacteria bacterium]|nr:hypothetical protein [Acidobacteriota bacterium]